MKLFIGGKYIQLCRNCENRYRKRINEVPDK